MPDKFLNTPLAAQTANLLSEVKHLANQIKAKIVGGIR